MRFSCCFLLLFPGLSLAEETKASAHYSSEIFSWVLSLLVVLVTIFLCAWVLKKTRLTQFGGGQTKVVANLALGTRERVVVVDIAGQQYLLGVTANSVNLLDKLATPLAKPQAANVSHSFAKQLERMLKKDEK